MGRYEDFLGLLDKRDQADDPAAFDKMIFDKYGETLTVMITDSSNFTRRTKQYGIIHFLSTMQKAYGEMGIVIQAHGGKVVKEWADDIFAVFPSSKAGLTCAMNMQKRLQEMNAGKPEEDTFTICVGLAKGEILFLEREIFGDAVNMASKLGEDLASSDDILLSESVYEDVQNEFPQLSYEQKYTKMSGVEFNYYLVNR